MITAAFTQTVVPMASEGVIDLLTNKLGDVQSLLIVAVTVVASVLILMQAIRTRGAIAAILISALVAGLLIYIVRNVTDLGDRVDNELSSAAGSAAPGATRLPDVA